MKACPFCAGLDIKHEGEWPFDDLECQDCGASGPRWLRGTYVEQWETRATCPDDVKNRLAEMAAELSDLAEGIRSMSTPDDVTKPRKA
jgi:hypothetical protein